MALASRFTPGGGGSNFGGTMFLPADVPLRGLEALPPRTVVLAAHPDDETIGVGCLLSVSQDCWVLYLTDGAPRDPRLRADRELQSYVAQRKSEAHSALTLAGVAPGHVRWLGGVDQEASDALVQLTGSLREWLSIIEPSAIVTHPYEGGHPDHDAAAFCARAARELLSRERGRAPLLLEMTSYHGHEGRLRTGQFLPPQQPFLALHLTPEQRDHKARMLSAYASQREVLSAFELHRELLRIAPRYDFRRPPHPGPLYFESQGWAEGAAWRAKAGQALRELALEADRCA